MNNNKYKFPKDYEYKITKKQDMIFGPYGTQDIHDEQIDDEYDDIVEERARKVVELLKIEYPEQRSEAWFKMRDGRITASDGATVIGENKYEPTYKFIMGKVFGKEFNSNPHTYHGKKLEKIATMIYEYRMNVHIEEFGMIGHPVCEIIGASPDGIIGLYKHDGKHKTKLVGRMLEIKCPVTREIYTEGEIKGHICPIYYWVQVQLQLECCDLDECDFWQCDIREYKNREEFIEDTDPEEPFRSKETGFEKGCLIQLLPFEHAKETLESQEKYLLTVYDKAQFIYPPKVEMTPYEVDQWSIETIDTYKNDPKLKDYYVDKVIYWKLCKSSCVIIYRDKEWYESNLHKYEKIWKYVKFLRKNEGRRNILKNYVDSLNIHPKAYKKNDYYNEKIMNVIDTLYRNKKESQVVQDIITEIEENNNLKENKISRFKKFNFKEDIPEKEDVEEKQDFIEVLENDNKKKKKNKYLF
jgi:putative phage-type endonuclease